MIEQESSNRSKAIFTLFARVKRAFKRIDKHAVRIAELEKSNSELIERVLQLEEDLYTDDDYFDESNSPHRPGDAWLSVNMLPAEVSQDDTSNIVKTPTYIDPENMLSSYAESLHDVTRLAHAQLTENLPCKTIEVIERLPNGTLILIDVNANDRAFYFADPCGEYYRIRPYDSSSELRPNNLNEAVV